MYRSTDAGEHWTPTSGGGMGYGVYGGRVVADPLIPGRAYVGSGGLAVTNDTGRTAKGIPHMPAADVHAVWVDPTNSEHVMIGNDHGIFISENAGKNWRHIENLTLARFWSIGADNREFFYRVYGSPQDSWGFGGPSRSRNAFGISSQEWISPPSAENGPIAIDPADTALVFATGARLFRFDVNTQHLQIIAPSLPNFGELDEAREHRRGGLIVSTHDHRVVYFATTRVWKSSDHGTHWTAISPNFVNPLPDSETVMGRRVREGRRRFETWNLQGAIIEKIAESPVDAGVLYAGTRDGTLMVTRDGGKSWRRTAPRPGAPSGVAVTAIVASHFDVATAYTATRAFDIGDHHAYVFKTTDYGAHWTSISSNIPDGADVWSLAEHFRAKGLLFVGTDDGLYASTDDGVHWAKLGGNFPRSGRVRDLLVQETANDLVVALWGRGAWVLDDITPLEHWASATRNATPYLFPVRNAMRFTLRGWTQYEEPQYGAPNPPYGALLSYYVTTSSSQRGDTIDIMNAKGERVRSFATDTTPGLHRFAWDLRWSTLGEGSPEGVLVRPGSYVASFRHASQAARKFDVLPDPVPPVSAAVLDSMDADARLVWHAQAEENQVASTGTTLLRQLDTISARLRQRSPADSGLLRRTRRLRDSVEHLLQPLEGSAADYLAAADQAPDGANIWLSELHDMLDAGRYGAPHPSPLLPEWRRILPQVTATVNRLRPLLKAFLSDSISVFALAARNAGLTTPLHSGDTTSKAESLLNVAELIDKLTKPLLPVVAKPSDYVKPPDIPDWRPERMVRERLQ